MKTYRVLIVDDEPVIRLDLRTMLEAMGHEVVGEADNGADALQLARTLQPDLVIADIMMPEMDGIELSRRLAKERIAPVLVLTAYSEPEMVAGADRAGATDRHPQFTVRVGVGVRLQRRQRLLRGVQRVQQPVLQLEQQVRALAQQRGARVPVAELRRRVQAAVHNLQSLAGRQLRPQAQVGVPHALQSLGGRRALTPLA